jgi:GNAT superfamily N-acetyltransferase
MQLLTFDELSDRQHTDRSLVQMAAFGGTFDRRRVEIWRRRTKVLAEYVGIFAVDRGTVVGHAFVQHIPYTFPGGTETIAGIASVATRSDRARAGVARLVLEEIHRRERKAGIRHAALWTNQSWGAHRLYEKLGYRDVYVPVLAVRAPVAPQRRLARPRVRGARVSDLSAVEALHAGFGRGRLGFAERPEGLLRVAVAAGELRPKEILLAREAGRTLGYATVDTGRLQTSCGELVGATAGATVALARAVELKGRTGTVTFRDGAVEGLRPWLRSRGYAIAPVGWFVLMGCTFGRGVGAKAARREFGTDRPEFLCFTGDRF